MQPITGLHIGSLIDRGRFDVRLYHEDWHGPFEPEDAEGYDLVFLTGLQPDFDRMRQLSYYFRRAGAKVVAGGSICTMFPEFAAQFFDAVCAGGVDCVREVVADFERGALKPIYRSLAISISPYHVDYSLLREAGIDPSSHLLEASRGCSFRCNFCVMPKEFGGHASYDLKLLSAAIDNSLEETPFFSFRRWYPTIIFMDNNFSDDRAKMIELCELLRNHPKIRGWAALVTQNVLHDRELISYLARAKCITLFVGLESFDHEFLRRQNKKQSLSARHNVIDDISYAESLGIGIGYGYLFDPRHQNVADMNKQIRAIGENPILPMPVYLSVVAPLAGTDIFWSDLAAGQLAPGLRLRDLDGETIAYRNLADETEPLTSFIERLFRRPWEIVSRFTILKKTLRRIARSGSLDPFHWYIIAAANLHCFVWSSTSPAKTRTYIAGTEVLDPQYDERPDDLSEADYRRYFEPVEIIDAHGHAADWLKPYIPETKRKREKQAALGNAKVRGREQEAHA
ncbi:MAG: B12-binding domain-containing radical SAM protein [Chthoniobacterales bacterium]